MPVREDEVQGLVEQLSVELQRSVLVDDAELRLLAYSPSRGADDEVRRTAILTRRTPSAVRDVHFSHGIAGATRAVHTAPRPDLGLRPRVCVPIRYAGVLFGYLWLIEDDETLSRGDTELAERSATEIGEAMYRREELEWPRQELARRALEGLIGPDAGRRAEAARELVDHDLIVPGTVGVLAMRCTGIAGRGPGDRKRLGPALEQLRRSLPARRSLGLVGDDHALVLVALDTHLQRVGGLADLARRAQGALEHLTIGFSEPWEQLTDAHRAHEQARSAMRVAACAPEHPSPAGWADLGAYRMLAQVAELPDAEGLLHPGLSRLLARQSSESLVATLETYLDNACDAKLTAETLFLHRASVYYRLQRIESLIGVSLHSGADRLALHASLKLARLLGVHPAPGENRELSG